MPDEIENPMKIQFKNYYYNLNFNLRKVDRMFFKEVIIKNDLGIMFEDNIIDSHYSYNELKYDYSYFKDEDYGKVGFESSIYKINFYFQKAYDHYHKSYMKIQELAAILGGFIKILLLTGGLCSNIFGKFIREEMLYKELFESNQTGLLLNSE
jgi:hypothetical protein